MGVVVIFIIIIVQKYFYIIFPNILYKCTNVTAENSGNAGNKNIIYQNLHILIINETDSHSSTSIENLCIGKSFYEFRTSNERFMYLVALIPYLHSSIFFSFLYLMTFNFAFQVDKIMLRQKTFYENKSKMGKTERQLS